MDGLMHERLVTTLTRAMLRAMIATGAALAACARTGTLTRAMLLAMIATGAALAGCGRPSTKIPTTFAWVLGG